MAPARSLHEDYSRKEEVEGGSDRSFGLVFAAFFAAVGLWPLWRDEALRPWALIVSGGLLLAALLRPALLAHPNRLWTRLGLLLGTLVTPIVMGILYFGVITPFGIAMRLSGGDPLRRTFDPDAGSYWIPREPPGPDPRSLEKQF